MENPDEFKRTEFEIIDLFMVMADLKRYFVGSMHRGRDKDGNEFVSGKVTVEEGVIVGRAENDKKMTKQLDVVCRFKLDFGLHNKEGKSTMILGTKYNHN